MLFLAVEPEYLVGIYLQYLASHVRGEHSLLYGKILSGAGTVSAAHIHSAGKYFYMVNLNLLVVLIGKSGFGCELV